MSDIIVYDGRLWKTTSTFLYTGAPEKFTLDPGEYLMICYGARGGGAEPGPWGEYIRTQVINYGGVSYGIINLDIARDFYAYVGGNGGDEPDKSTNTPGEGGWNGGGRGSKAYSTSYWPGFGGGGATDIRIKSEADFPGDAHAKQYSLNTRIMVAGGGGGSTWFNAGSYTDDWINYSGIGGGTVGGYVSAVNNAGSEVNKYPTQTAGYSFGDGENCTTASPFAGWTAEGRGGGGGGWYGGYALASANSVQYTSTGGGGGSGYVLTDDSYKPTSSDAWNNYFADHIYYHFTKPLLMPGQSANGKILICQEIQQVDLQSGDVIRMACTADVSSCTLPAGTYRMKCWGADGGVRYAIWNSARGGYAEGEIEFQEPTLIHGYVGGSGLFDDALNATYPKLINPSLWFNGGGRALQLGPVRGAMRRWCSSSGGGGTDIRLKRPEDFTSRLPEGYRELTHINSYGLSYIDTGVIPDSTTWIELKVSSNDANHDMFVFGTRNAPADREFCCVLNAYTYSFPPPQNGNHLSYQLGSVGWNGGQNCVNITQSLATPAVYKFNHEGAFVNGEKVYTMPQQPSSYSSYPIFLFSLNNNGSVNTAKNFYGNLYWCKIYSNDTIIRDFVPCLRMSDYCPGLYDLVNNTFYPNTSSTWFVAGEDIIQRKSLNTRFIVAGGGGGQSASNNEYAGGTGGGLTGGESIGGTGTNLGPGTQSGAAVNLAQEQIQGGFGYGGRGGYQSFNYAAYGPAGGGGWYGGSGTLPASNDSNYNMRSGAGGSGFVWSLESVGDVPEDYALDQTYFMSNGRLVSGGNDLYYGQSQIEIDVIEIRYPIYILIQDQTSIKYWDQESSRWVSTPTQQLTTNLFEIYGVNKMEDDTGIVGNYDILTYDPYHMIDDMALDVVPTRQKIETYTDTDKTVSNIDPNMDVDRSVYNVQIETRRHVMEHLTRLTTTVYVDKIHKSSETMKMYYITYSDGN